jgi:cobalt-zinc-cadmium efflux system outer membrane protein
MKPHGLTLAIAGTLFSAAAGCQTASRCCHAWFAPAPASFADSTPVPERVLTASHSSENADRTNADGSSGDGTDQSMSGSNNEKATGETPRRFNIPSELPGANASPLTLPPMDESNTPEQKRSIAQSLFPDVKSLDEPDDSVAEGEALTLTTLQQMAVDNSPVIRQAAADVESARGEAVQRGLYPNPVVGYEGDTIGTARTAGYNGVFFTQELVTAGKLTLAQNTALNQVRAAQADLRKARIALATDVRRSYFKVLIAQEQLRFSRAIARLSNEVYQAQIDLVAGGEAAPYEPLQLRVIAVQARNDVVSAKNGLDAAWRTLAAAVGIPHLQRQHVAGSVEHAIPDLDYQTLATMLQRHSDLIAANARIAASGCNLRLQEVTPIPNVTLYGAFQHDDTTPLSDYSTNVQLSAPVPVFNKNQGNIATAHAQLVRARQDLNDINNKLMAQLADVFNRHQTSQTIAASYRTDLLPDQVRVYRGVYDRFLLDGESIDFAQVVVAQQTLTQVVNSYLKALSDSWMATVDLAELLQVDDIMTMDGMTVNGMTTGAASDVIVPASEVPPAAEMLQGAVESVYQSEDSTVETQSQTERLQSAVSSTFVSSNIASDAVSNEPQTDEPAIEQTDGSSEPAPAPPTAQPPRRSLPRP